MGLCAAGREMPASQSFLELGLFSGDEVQEGIPVSADGESGNFPGIFSLSDDKTNI